LWGMTCVVCIDVEHVDILICRGGEVGRWVGMGSTNDEHLIARNVFMSYDKCAAVTSKTY